MSARVYQITFIDIEKLELEKQRERFFEKLQERIMKGSLASERLKESIGKIAECIPPEVYSEELTVKSEDVERVQVFFSLQKERLTVTLANPELAEDKCEEIIMNFVRKLYKEMTNKELVKERVKIETVGRLKHSLCQCCSKMLLEIIAYQCSLCKGIYCSAHIQPESHGCKKRALSGRLKIEALSTKHTS